jgi:DNA processing protein
LTKEEETIINALEKQHPVSINELSRKLKTPVSKLSSALLKLEFDGLVKALPGSNFKLV